MNRSLLVAVFSSLLMAVADPTAVSAQSETETDQPTSVRSFGSYFTTRSKIPASSMTSDQSYNFNSEVTFLIQRLKSENLLIQRETAAMNKFLDPEGARMLEAKLNSMKLERNQILYRILEIKLRLKNESAERLELLKFTHEYLECELMKKSEKCAKPQKFVEEFDPNYGVAEMEMKEKSKSSRSKMDAIDADEENNERNEFQSYHPIQEIRQQFAARQRKMNRKISINVEIN